MTWLQRLAHRNLLGTVTKAAGSAEAERRFLLDSPLPRTENDGVWPGYGAHGSPIECAGDHRKRRGPDGERRDRHRESGRLLYYLFGVEERGGNYVGRSSGGRRGRAAEAGAGG